ncbi:MAG: hypothetical protein KAS32_07615 [Candidatus Peribacteraceae bacterium]|nr:hypothetical protein [Candidatus Peribacteraceae bacterium]
MITLNHCSGCHDNYYNPNCWSRKSGNLVWRLPIGVDEVPPYKGKKKKRVPNCWHGGGSNRTTMVKPESINTDGYWKMF